MGTAKDIFKYIDLHNSIRNFKGKWGIDRSELLYE